MGAYRLRGIFSKNLKDVLSRNGITQAELADMMGVSYSSVSAWCTGVKMPRMDKIEWIANRFGIQKSDLIEDRGDLNNVASGCFAKVQYAGPIAAHFNATPTELHEYWPCRRNGWDTASPRISLLPWWTATPCTRIIKTVIISFVCGALIWSIPGASVLCCWRAAKRP